MEKYLIRKASIDDAYWIAFVNVHTWRSAYQWLIPEKILETRIQSINEMAVELQKSLKKWTTYLVAENVEKNKIIWILCYSSSRNNQYANSWEICSIYLLHEYQKLGIGKKLFMAWIKELVNMWYKDMILNVLEWNKTITFYEKYWWKIVGERYEQFGKKTLKEYIMFFDNIRDL